MATMIHGIAASENIDSSGERIIIAGMDISSLEKDGVFNWEHKSDQPAQVVGKILKAKKIFSEKDCENEDERRFWEKCGVPFVYVMGELLDDYKESAKEVAAQFRYDHDHKDRDKHGISNFSIEGAKINKVGMDIPNSIARKVTITVHPCNKVAEAHIKLDNKKIKKNDDIDSLFKTETTEIELFKTEDLRYGQMTMADAMAKKEDPAAHAQALGVSPMKKDDQDLAGTAGAPAKIAQRALPHVKNDKITPGSTPIVKANGPATGHLKIVGANGTKLGTTSGGQEIHSHKRVHEYGPMHPKDHLEAANMHFNAASAARDPKTGSHHMDKVRLHMEAHKTASKREERLHPDHKEKLLKTLDAGSMMAPPSNLAGGAALQSESLSSTMNNTSFGMKRKQKKNPDLARAEEEYQVWGKKEEFVGFMQQKLPNFKKHEIDAVGRTVALKKGMEDSKKWLAKFGYGEQNTPGGSHIAKSSDMMMESEKSKSELKKFFSKAISDQAKDLKTKDINELC
jgi:hypothetical protein